MISKLKKRYFDFCVNCKLRRDSFYRGYSSFIMCLLGVGLLIYGFSDFSIASGAATVKKPIEYDDFYIKRAVCTLYAFIEGSFGALLAVVAGIGAIVSSAFGGYKSAISFIVVSCGSFILRALVSLFFGTLEHLNVVMKNFLK